MPTFGRQQPTYRYGRLGLVVDPITPIVPIVTEPLEIEEMVVVQGGAGQIQLYTILKNQTETKVKIINTDLAVLKNSQLPISVNQDGKLVLNADVIINGSIETSTESGQIIGDTKDTVLEDIDGGTF